MTKHTPGPWYICHAIDCHYIGHEMEVGGYHPIVSLPASPDREDEANAILIASAPDLLAACIQAENLLLSCGLITSQWEAARDTKNKITEAINKAKATDYRDPTPTPTK